MIKIDITNQRYTGDEELIIYQYSGALEDLPDRVKEVLTLKEAEELDGGDWITILDSEVVEVGEFHPFSIHVDDGNDAPLDEQLEMFAEEHSSVLVHEYDALEKTAEIIRKRT